MKQKLIMAKKNHLTTSDHLPYNEFDKLLTGLHKDGEYFWELYARLSFCTACRISDVLNLKWNDVLRKSCVVTEQKTGKTRKITFNPSVQKKIQELYKLLGSPNRDGYVFANSKTGKPISTQYVNRTLKKWKYRYKLPIDHFSSHTFRKTFGRYVYDQSNHSAESLLLLNRILNHSNIQVTKTYIGITQEEIDSVFDSITF
jgi:integrase